MISQEENQLLTDLHKLMTLVFYFNFLAEWDHQDCFNYALSQRGLPGVGIPLDTCSAGRPSFWAADGNHGVICSTTLDGSVRWVYAVGETNNPVVVLLAC